MNPELFVIAGPNGAGKTTYGRAFVPEGVTIFNGDLVFANLVKQYPHVDLERLKGGVPVALERARDEAIALRTSFGFETNFSSDLTIDLINHFKANGYKANLTYMGLDDLLSAKARVSDRIAHGGHDVLAEVIRYNFEEGVKRVVESLHRFDTIEFIDNAFEPKVIAVASASPWSHRILNNIIRWFNVHFKAELERLFLN